MLTTHVMPSRPVAQACDRLEHSTKIAARLPIHAGSKSWRHVALAGLMVLSTVLSSGCANLARQGKTDAEKGPQAISTLEEHLVRARRAEEAGEKDRARDGYRAAAKAYPVAEEPWQRLAESYFNAGDYGNAIQAAQEVMQRDPKDAVAASVQAISGLRLSTQALNILREQAESQKGKGGSASAKPLTNASIIVAARLEAETLARQLREVLGEPALLPSASGGASGNRIAPRPVQASRSGAPAHAALPQSPAAGAPPTKPVAPAAPAVSAKSAGPAGNPFDKLK